MATHSDSDYAAEAKRLKHELRDEEQRAEDSRQLYEFFKRHRDVVACDANRSVLLSYFGEDPLTEQALEDSLQHPKLRERLAFVTESVDREMLEQSIIELLRPAGSDNAITGMQASFKWKSNEELHQIFEELQRKQQMRARSTQELREMVRRPLPGMQEVPVLYRSRNMLIALANENPSEFRSLMKRCGTEALNRILASNRHSND